VPRAADDGAPASEGAGADRRPVTVLFADLSGFTALSERLDPEDIRVLQGDLFQLMASAVERYEGFVEKFVGDAMMAIFGAPVAHEDDPERALRAALAMRERMAALNGRWAGRLGRSLALHTGIHTGPVVAGTLGSTPGAAYAVTGDTVNTASRLQAAAGAGEILASRVTYRLTQHAFEFEAVGDLSMKGKAAPVAAYRLVGALAIPRPARGLEAHGLVARLVGRDEELGQLIAAFQRMLSGRTQVVSLIGEAGVGKSRLQAEFLTKLEAGEHSGKIAVRRANSSSLGEKTYGVLASLLQEAYGVAPDDSLEAARRKLESGLEALDVGAEETARIAAVLGYVLGLGQEETRMRHLEPEQLKRQIFLAARALIEARLEASPLLLIVEDLHWADPASLELLRFLVDRLPDRRLMLLLAYRPTVDAAIVVSSRATHTSIRLEPLSPKDSDALLASLFGPVERCPERLHTLIVERAGGNPFYLEEMVRNLIANGVLVRDGGGWTCTADAAIVDVPVTIRGVILSRLDRLAAVPRRVIQEAAVIGASFDQRLLRMVSGDQASEALLEALTDIELLAEEPQGRSGEGPAPAAGRRYRFTHALVQEVAYENSSERATALEHYEAVLAGCTSTGDLCGQARVNRKLGTLYWAAGDRERALGCFRAGLNVLRGQREHIELAHLYQEMGRLAFRSGDNNRAMEWAERALAQAEHAGRESATAVSETGEETREAAAAVAHAYNTLGVALARLGKMDEAVAHIERSVAVAEKADLLQAVCRGFANLGVLYSTLNPGRAIETCARGLELAKKIGDLAFQSRLYANLAVAYCALTNRCDEKGLCAAQAAVDLDRRLGQLDHLAVPLIVLGQIYQCHGEPERALTHYREALTIAEEVGEPQLLFPCYDGLATLCLEMGDDQQAEHHLLKAQAVCERAGLEPDALAVLPFLD